MGQKIDLIFLLDQTLLHCLATPAEHRLGAPRTSAADLRGDLRLKRSSVRASQPTAELLDDVFALLQKFSPHQTPPSRGAILGVRHSRAKVDSGTKPSWTVPGSPKSRMSDKKFGRPRITPMTRIRAVRENRRLLDQP
jgi:hypothetical protein